LLSLLKQNGEVKEILWQSYQLQYKFQMVLQCEEEIQKENSSLFKSFPHFLSQL